MSADQITPEVIDATIQAIQERLSFNRSIEERVVLAIASQRDSLRAEVQRLTEEVRRLREIEVSDKVYGMLTAHGSDGVVLVCGEFNSGREFREKYRVACRSDAGRVEVPELTEDDIRRAHDWMDGGKNRTGVQVEADMRSFQEVADELNKILASRLSPYPQPATGAVARLNARIVYPATCKDSLQVPQPSADVVVVVPTDLVDEIVGRHEAAKSLLANEPDDLGTEDADPMEVTQWSNELGYQQDKLNEALDRLSALRSSTNHDSKETP